MSEQEREAAEVRPERFSNSRGSRAAFASAASTDEESLYFRGEDFWRGIVSLTFQRAVLRIGQDFRERSSRIAYPFRARPTVHHERGCGGSGPLISRQRVACHVVSQDGDVVGQGMRHGFERRPCWRASHLSDGFGRRAHHFGHPELYGVTSAIGRYQLVDVPDKILRRRRTAVVDNEWWLVQRELSDLGGELGRGLQGKDRARGLAVDKRRSACFINEGLEIFDLALDGIWRRVFTIASAPAIVS